MARKILDGMLVGVGIAIVVGVAFAIAWAGDVFTVDKDGTVKFAVSDAGKIMVGATESYVNLVIQNNAAAANNTVDIAADVLTVEGIRLENVNVSADITASGAGGLDTGGEDPNAWYYVWVIANNSGASTNGLLSTSSTSPILPSGFTRKRRVGAVRNNAAGDFLQFSQEGNKCNYLNGFGGNRTVTAGTSTSFTVANATAPSSNFIPPTSRRGVFTLQMSINHTDTTTIFTARIRKADSSGTNGQFVNAIQPHAIGLTARNFVSGDVETDASQQVEYQLSVAPGNSGGVNIDVLGYYDRI
ncbi:MAG: hypothetical protein A2Z34_11590 [Planctomycetes bacterium RBG_16_59_8]|nr:MAG: hypothetical protein A2Z34_11590 [Planctomycetes bacterium RBG_16_59_8]